VKGEGERGERFNVEFAIAIRRDYRGKGFGKRMLKEVIRLAKEKLNAKHLWISYIEGNERVKRLYESLGFKKVCRLKDYCYYENEWRDVVVMKYMSD